MSEKMYTIHELTEGEYATDNEIICSISIVNGEKKYVYYKQYIEWVLKGKKEKLYTVSDIENMEIENLIYIIGYSDGADTGYVGYDNTPCNNLDYAMSFSTRLEAKNNLNALQSEWKSKLSIIEVPKE